MKRGLVAALAVCFIMMVIYACSKTEFVTNSTFEVRLSGGALAAEKVNIDIKEVRIKTSEDTAWQLLPTQYGVYDLSKYQNSVDTAVASGAVGASLIVREVRFVFGSENSISFTSFDFLILYFNSFFLLYEGE